MPMHQNFNFTSAKPLEDSVKIVERIMGRLQWRLIHEFDKFDMSIDFDRAKKRSLFGRDSDDDNKPEHVDLSITLRFKEIGDKVTVYLLSPEAMGDSVAAASRPPSPEKRKLLTDAHNALKDALT